MELDVLSVLSFAGWFCLIGEQKEGQRTIQFNFEDLSESSTNWWCVLEQAFDGLRRWIAS